MVGQWKRIPLGIRIAEIIWSFLVGVTIGAKTGSILLGGGLAAISRKILFGDWDVGQAWTVQDVGFWTMSFLEGAAGAWVAEKLGLHTLAEEQAIRVTQQVDRFQPTATRMPGENEGSQTWYMSNEGARTDTLNTGSG